MDNWFHDCVSTIAMEQDIRRGIKAVPVPMSVAIISYNSRELLRACLKSIETEQCDEVIVVDNASSDGSDEMVREDFPNIRLISNEQNSGYGAAANLAIASCSSDYILLLNSDTLLQPGTIQALCNYLNQHLQAAIVGPSLVNLDGSKQESCFPFPTPLQTLFRETSLPALQLYLPKIHSGNGHIESPQSGRTVDWVLGAAMAIRRQAFEAVGGFDTSFFMYYEEVDLCYRLNKAGWQIHYLPAASVAHIGGASTKQHRTAMAIQLYQSLCQFYRHHYSHKDIYRLKLVITYLMLRNVVVDTFRLARVTDLSKGSHLADDLLVWRSVLYNLWSSNGWLKG